MRTLVVVGLLALAAPAHAEVDDAWAKYDAAFVSLASGDREAARTGLEAVVAVWPDHPAAVKALARLGELGAEMEAPASVAPPPTTSRVARAELILGMTVTGVFAGVEACVDVCDQERSYAAAMMVGGGGALGLTLLASRHGVQSGEAQLYNSATTWGRWNALGLNDGFAETSQEAWISLGAQAAGLGAGLGLWRVWQPTSGDVALANSGMLWGTVMTMWGAIMIDKEPTFPIAVIAGDVGIALGAALGSEIEMSRGRTLLIDTGGVLGTLLGGLLVVGMADDGTSDKALGGVMMVSTAAGLAIAALATQHWDDPPASVHGK